MARIKGLGVMNSLPVYNEEKYPPGWNYAFVIKLDDPIEVDPEFLESISRSTDIPTDIDLFTMMSDITICNGEIGDPYKALDHEPDQDMIDSSSKAIELIPSVLIDAFKAQNAYGYAHLSLIHDNVVNPGLGEYMCDIRIDLYLPDKIRDSDRFLQSLARKLNKWLAAV